MTATYPLPYLFFPITYICLCRKTFSTHITITPPWIMDFPHKQNIF